MKMSKLYPSKYLASDDLNGKTVTVKIDHVVLEEVGAQKDWKPVIYFQKAKKPMVLNRTNANMIASAYGDDSDHWKGKPVLLRAEKVSFQGRVMDGLRIHIPQRPILPEELEPEELGPPVPDDDEAPPEQLDDEVNPFD